jgi:hypothetical protein
LSPTASKFQKKWRHNYRHCQIRRLICAPGLEGEEGETLLQEETAGKLINLNEEAVVRVGEEDEMRERRVGTDAGNCEFSKSDRIRSWPPLHDPLSGAAHAPLPTLQRLPLTRVVAIRSAGSMLLSRWSGQEALLEEAESSGGVLAGQKIFLSWTQTVVRC